jgi:hypothetical protein
MKCEKCDVLLRRAEAAEAENVWLRKALGDAAKTMDQHHDAYKRALRRAKEHAEPEVGDHE